MDTTGLGTGAASSMDMLYERTIFKVDVLELSLRFGSATTQQLAVLVASGDAAALAAAALEARDVLVRARFLRDASLGQFLDGLESNLHQARRAGIVDRAEFDRIMGDVRTQYAPLSRRGFLDGDIMWYRVRGDALHVVIQDASGEIVLEERVSGPERRRAVLGGYLAPGSDFRDGLIASLRARNGGR